MLRNDAKDSLIHEANKELGICEQLRRVYDSVYKLPEGEIKEELTEKLIDAFMMAKNIANRLQYYYDTYHDESGHQGKNTGKILHDKQILFMRRKR